MSIILYNHIAASCLPCLLPSSVVAWISRCLARLVRAVSLVSYCTCPNYKLRLAHALTLASNAGDRIGVLTVWKGFSDA